MANLINTKDVFSPCKYSYATSSVVREMNVWNISIGQKKSSELLHTLLNSGLLNNFNIEMELGDILHWK